jgi:predicted tellurium resistance membrane protein TerC
MADALGLLALLIGLELVLGVDNVLVIAIFVGRLPENKRQKARIIGLSLALVARIVMLAVVVALASLTRPIVANFSVRDLILLAGGLFLLYKAVHEIHHTVEFREEARRLGQAGKRRVCIHHYPDRPAGHCLFHRFGGHGRGPYPATVDHRFGGGAFLCRYPLFRPSHR